MESDHDVERIQVAIQKLMEENRRRKDGSLCTFNDGDDEKLLLSELLSQLGSKEPTISKETTRITLSTRDAQVEGRQEGASACAAEEIAKELREVKKQNRITHWLLSALIVVTLGWQLSEVSLILKLKNGLSNPFRSLGQFLVGMGNGNGDADKQKSNEQQQSQPFIEIPFTSHSANS